MLIHTGLHAILHAANLMGVVVLVNMSGQFLVNTLAETIIELRRVVGHACVCMFGGEAPTTGRQPWQLQPFVQMVPQIPCKTSRDQQSIQLSRHPQVTLFVPKHPHDMPIIPTTCR